MTRFSAYLTQIVLNFQAKLESEEGVSAMEYFVMMVGLVIMVFTAFKYAGTQINNGVHSFINQVMGGI